jgi:hypothetical protein
MKKSVVPTVLCALVGVSASAQDFHRAEVFGDYTYMQFNPTLTGLQSRALNGGGGGFQVNMRKFFAIKGEFQGYQSTQWTLNVTSPLTTPGGAIIPVGTYKSNANMFTYLFGPVIRMPTRRITPFAEALFGGSNTNLYGRLYSQTITGGQSAEAGGTQHPFTMALGGGFDINVTKHIAIRPAEMDYVLTRYTNPFTNTNNQNSFRYLGGIVFKLGVEKPPPPPPAPKPTTKTCPTGVTVPIDSECPKRTLSVGITAAETSVCPGATVIVTPRDVPPGATLQWSVNGDQVSQAPTFQFGTNGLKPGPYRIAMNVKAEGYEDGTAETTVNVKPGGAPAGTVRATPNEIWVGEKAALSADFRAGECGGTLQQPVYQASDGSVSGNEFDSNGVQFDPSISTEQRKTVTITARVSDGANTGSAETSVVVKKKPAAARRFPDIIFPVGSARVNNCGKRILLEELRTSTSADPGGKVVLVGHQSDKEKKPADLAAKRALNAAAVISAGQGVCASIPASQVLVATSTDNDADFQPHFCEASAGAERSGQKINQKDDTAKYRRVEVWFVPSGGQLPASAKNANDAASQNVSKLGCPK